MRGFQSLPAHQAREGRDTTMQELQQLSPPETGFTVAERLSLRGWMNAPTEGWGEYIHLFPDVGNGVAWLFRAYKETGDPRRLVTAVPNARFHYNDRHNPVHAPRGKPLVAHPSERSEHGRYEHDAVEPRSWYFTGAEGDTLISFFDLFGREQGDPVFKLVWYGDNGKSMMEGSPIREESVYLHYRTDGGKERRVLISSAYETTTQMLARPE